MTAHANPVRSEFFGTWKMVRLCARTFTAHELADFYTEYTAKGEHHRATLILEAISIHACRTTWGDLIEQSMNRKEEDRGHHETSATH